MRLRYTRNRFQPGMRCGSIRIIKKVDNRWKVQCRECSAEFMVSVRTLYDRYHGRRTAGCLHCTKKHTKRCSQQEEINEITNCTNRAAV